ncbi:MAG: hypothetical protein ABFD57_05395 [Smithella sp.]
MDKFERYWKLSEMEERYNSSSAGIRGLASAWLLASLGAMGWLFSSYNYETWPLPLGFLIVVVATMGCFGMITLWVMDQLVFHRLLTSVFIVGLKIEKDDKEIPPIRSMMMKSQEGLGTHRWERFFYLSPVFIFILISFVVIIAGSNKLFSAEEIYFPLNTLYISVFLVIAQSIAVIWMITKLPSMSLKTQASYFDDQEFTKLVADSGFEMTVARFRSKPDGEKQDEG